MSTPKFAIGLLIFAIAAVFLLGIDNYPLTERSEARYAGVAWEMLQSHDYLTPRFNGIKHFHKPPLFYWTMVAGMSILGPTEMAARLPTTLAAFGVLIVVWWMASKGAFAPKKAWMAVACLATAPFFWEMGRIAVTDMIVTFLVTTALAASWMLLSQRMSWPAWTVFWVSLGLNFLAKGPVGPLIVGLVVVPYCFATRTNWRNLRPLIGLLAAALVGLPWYLWILRDNPGLLSYLFKFQTVDRVFTTVHHRGGPVWFYLPILFGGFLPWSLWLLGPLRSSFSKVRNRTTPTNPDLFLLLWILAPVLFFSAIGSKLPPYVLPVFPAMALLVARGFEQQTSRTRLWPMLVFTVVGIFCLVQVAYDAVPLLLTFHENLVWTGAWLLLGGLASAVVACKTRGTPLLVVYVTIMLGLQGLAGVAFAKLAYLSAKPMASKIQDTASGPYEVAMYRRYLFGLPYYLKQRVVHVEYPRETQFETDTAYQEVMVPHLAAYLQNFRKNDEDHFLIVSHYEWPQVEGYFTEPVIFTDRRYRVLYHRAKLVPERTLRPKAKEDPGS